MDFILPKHLQQNISVAIIRPPYEKGTLMPFADTTTVTGAFGEVLLQSLIRKDFAIYQHVFRMKEDVRIRVNADRPMITLTYALKGIIPCNLNGFGMATLSEGWYHLYYVPQGKHWASVPGEEAIILQINLYADLLQELGNRYQAFREVCRNVISESKRGLQQDAAEITPKVRELLNSICHCKLQDTELELFLRARIYDLLLLYLEELNASQKDFNTRYHFTEDDLQSLHKASALLREHLNEPFPQHRLAKEVHLHPKKLAAGFRMLYGANIRDWILKTKIDKAKQLLKETNSSINEIAAEVGYDATSAFIRAFKGVVGCTPSDYRK